MHSDQRSDQRSDQNISWTPIAQDLIFTKNDLEDLRLGDLVRVPSKLSGQPSESFDALFDELEKSTLIFGYPDDEGIQANGGRLGAKEAPDRIRKYLYRMTPPAFLQNLNTRSPLLLDVGNLNPDSTRREFNLKRRHDFARASISSALKHGHRSISLGGGHDYGYSDAMAYIDFAKGAGAKPLIINFDAHLDVRPDTNGINSGTPFYRVLNEAPDVELIELGLQYQCNSASHLNWLRDRGGSASFEEDRKVSDKTLLQCLVEMLGDRALRRQPVFLSIDIDGFSSAVAPGASQSWPTGFLPDEFFEVFRFCLGRFDVRNIGIYEVSPPLDVDDRTSRLAALIAYQYVFQLGV